MEPLESQRMMHADVSLGHAVRESPSCCGIPQHKEKKNV